MKGQSGGIPHSVDGPQPLLCAPQLRPVRQPSGDGRKRGHIADDDQIFASGFVNSMFAMQLVLFLEKNFKIAIGNEDLELKNFQSINAMAELIQRKTSNY